MYCTHTGIILFVNLASHIFVALEIDSLHVRCTHSALFIRVIPLLICEFKTQAFHVTITIYF